jgi:hypothetical protein
MGIRLSSVRPALLGGVLLASVAACTSGCASAWRCQTCSSPSEAAALDTVEKPFEGAAYSFGPREGYTAYYPGAPDSARNSLPIPYVANYYGPFPRAARDLRRPFYEPGPYFYTPTPPYARSYYGYYDTPSYFRY